MAADSWQVIVHNSPVDIRALHVWVGIHNPAGVFADFNPDVGCEVAPEP